MGREKGAKDHLLWLRTLRLTVKFTSGLCVYVWECVLHWMKKPSGGHGVCSATWLLGFFIALHTHLLPFRLI